MYDRAPRLLRLAEGGSTEAHVGPGSYQVPFPKERDAGKMPGRLPAPPAHGQVVAVTAQAQHTEQAGKGLRCRASIPASVGFATPEPVCLWALLFCGYPSASPSCPSDTSIHIRHVSLLQYLKTSHTLRFPFRLLRITHHHSSPSSTVTHSCSDHSQMKISFGDWYDFIIPGGYAPFLSWSARESSFTVASNTEKALPGPGHYNISKAQSTIKGGNSLKNREIRFKKIISDNPGPASYDQCYPGSLDMNQKLLEAKEHLLKKSSRPSAVNRSLDIPSIPSYRQSHGYEINDDGIVKRLSAPYNDSTLGPAYYKPQFDAPRASLKYKGIHFGTSSRSRQFLPIQPGPGPGQYDIVQEKTLHYENVNVKKDHQESCASFLPRFFDLIPLQEKKRQEQNRGIPGPGKYEIKSQFQKTESTTLNVNDASPAFLSQSQRFIPTKSVTPAPGAYNAIQTPVKCSKKAPVKNTPFGQGAARFKQICKKEQLPGPGFYNILHNTIIDNIKNICSKKNNKCAFGSSTPRSFFQISKESPGPSHYQKAWNSSVSTTAEELPNLKNNYAIFLSRTKKKKYTVVHPVLPAPGSYEVHKSYEMSQIKRKYMPPRSSIAEKNQSSFLSGTPRYQEKTTEGPGPGEYDPVLKKSCPIPLFVKVPKRFQDVEEDSPGPTTYELSTFLRHSVLKKTFNVTLPNFPLMKSKNTNIKENAKEKTSTKAQETNQKLQYAIHVPCSSSDWFCYLSGPDEELGDHGSRYIACLFMLTIVIIGVL
ncbi:sperm-tail PG-rich repeat-containing protein 2 [Dipodomys spectabilis]|uniref:sperm-tail PG-rich repeat-containing protein 2 n=1 Tax=Dipodomys spectabilis TaxID=105255 RepID=UPI001C53914D|nr:sperm-tail PG-rich repeat-containing protein 2 [Dipodomys spectabilis]